MKQRRYLEHDDERVLAGEEDVHVRDDTKPTFNNGMVFTYLHR